MPGIWICYEQVDGMAHIFNIEDSSNTQRKNMRIYSTKWLKQYEKEFNYLFQGFRKINFNDKK